MKCSTCHSASNPHSSKISPSDVVGHDWILIMFGASCGELLHQLPELAVVALPDGAGGSAGDLDW